MAKKSRKFKAHPGEVERLTALIEQKASEIARVLLWDVSDAGQTAGGAQRASFTRKNKPTGRGISSVKPKKKRDLNLLQRVNSAKHGSSWRG